jgi:hypothetical protein
MERVMTDDLDVNATRQEALRLLPASEDKPPTGKLVDLSLNLEAISTSCDEIDNPQFVIWVIQ